MGTLTDRITINRVLETASLEDGANLNLVKYVDGGYGIARDRKPLDGFYWEAGQIEECLAEFTRLAGHASASAAKAQSDAVVAKKRVLIVDDEPEITELLKMYLDRLGRFDVRVENQSSHVMKAARSFDPHVILLDVMMPEPDGSEVAAFLQDDPQLKHVPIIFVTALVSQMESSKPLFGFDRGHFLAKPINFEELLQHLDHTGQAAFCPLGTGKVGGSRMCG